MVTPTTGAPQSQDQSSLQSEEPIAELQSAQKAAEQWTAQPQPPEGW